MTTHEIALSNKACPTCLALAVMLDDDENYEESFTYWWLTEDRFAKYGY